MRNFDSLCTQQRKTTFLDKILALEYRLIDWFNPHVKDLTLILTVFRIFCSRYVMHRGILRCRFCPCRTWTGSCRAARAVTARAAQRTAHARRMSAIRFFACVWRSISRGCLREARAVTEADLLLLSVGILFLSSLSTTRTINPGLCCPSVSRGRWVEKAVLLSKTLGNHNLIKQVG